MQAIYEKLDELVSKKQHVIIAIDGQAASGKTTLAYELQKKYAGEVVHLDDYFLRLEQKTASRLNEIGGNIDYERFQEEIIVHLKDENIVIKPYNCSTNTFDHHKVISNQKLLIIEGAYALRKEWRDLFDMRILVTIDSKLQKERIIKRNGEILFQKFNREWIPKENAYIEDQKLKSNVNFIIHVTK